MTCDTVMVLVKLYIALHYTTHVIVKMRCGAVMVLAKLHRKVRY